MLGQFVDVSGDFVDYFCRVAVPYLDGHGWSRGDYLVQLADGELADMGAFDFGNDLREVDSSA